MALACAVALPANAQSAGASNQANQENQLSDPGSSFVGTGSNRSWHATVERTDRGYRIGNPKADAALIEFISYTCGHCADFAREGEGALDLALLAPGHMTVEVRPVIRNAVDLTVSMLVQCGGTEDFKDRHRMYMTRQEDWLGKARTAPQAQMATWSRGDKAARINMATALDLDDMLAERGVSRVDISNCLSDDAAALKIIENGNADRTQFNVTGTPSFALDGELLAGVHNWTSLYPVIEARFRPGNGQK